MSVYLRLLDRVVNFHEIHGTIKAFPQMGEVAEHSEADEGKRSFLHIESAATKRLPLGREAVRLVLTDEARNPPLWQIQADAAPMRQRVLQASALQNDYAEL
ncbi:MAG: hypothetical protein MR219_06660 [Clostridiales bacterium]|nr:hypothetical protein [Clostridiales bacterium]